MRHLVLLTAMSGVLTCAALASAQPPSSAGRTWLGEVTADPRDGNDWLALDRARGRFDQLELRAWGGDVFLRGVSLHLPDGTVITTAIDEIVPAGTRRLIDVPLQVRRVERIELDYGSPRAHARDRSQSRLAVTALEQRR